MPHAVRMARAAVDKPGLIRDKKNWERNSFCLLTPALMGDTFMNSNTGEYAIGWFTLSLINAGLAQAKGRSGLSWWFISLFLGPIATFLVVALDPIKKP